MSRGKVPANYPCEQSFDERAERPNSIWTGQQPTKPKESTFLRNYLADARDGEPGAGGFSVRVEGDAHGHDQHVFC